LYVCAYPGEYSISNNIITSKAKKEEQKQRLNIFQRLTQYLVGLKVKADKLKKYYKLEF